MSAVNSMVLQWTCPLPHLYQAENEVQLIPGVDSLRDKYIFPVRQLAWKCCCHDHELQEINLISRLASLPYAVSTVLTWDGLGSLP